jgi:hypothetical protein
MAELLQGEQCEVQLLQKEQPMPVWTLGEQQRTKLLLRRQYEVQLLQKEQRASQAVLAPSPHPRRHPPPPSQEIPAHPLSQRENRVEEGEGTCLLLNLAVLAPSPHPRRFPPPP